MTNLSKVKREKIISFLKTIREQHSDDETLIAINEIEKEIISKKYGLIWEEHEEDVDVAMQTQIPVFEEIKEREIIGNEHISTYNFLLEGDNLHSLKILEKTHRHKLDVIYIDPPYNTGAKDWKYNNDYVDKVDTYRHSKWISMMYSRMKIARNLLKDDGVFICAIDENELGTTLLLIEDVFGPGYAVDPITVVHNPRGIQGDNFSYVNEYAIFVYRKGYKVIGERIVEEDDIDWSPLRNWGSESERNDARNCFYPIFVKDDKIVGFGDVTPNEIHPTQTEYLEESGIYAVYPIDVKGVERKWRYARQTVEGIWELLRAKKTKTGYDIELGKNFAPYKTVWTEKKYDANEYGTQLINSMVPNNDFSFPKSVYTVYDCLFAVLRNRKNAIVLDYFAGSGTTGHAVLMLNKNLGSNHSFILCTNNDVGEEKEKEFRKEYGDKSIHGAEWADWQQMYGIASSVTYPRLKSAIEGFTHSKDFKNVLYQKKLTVSTLKSIDKVFDEVNKIIANNHDKYDEIKLDVDENTLVVLGIIKKTHDVVGIPANLKYFTTKFVEKDSEMLVDNLMENISEFVQLQYGSNMNSEEYVMILDDEDMDTFEKNIQNFPHLKKVYISQDVLLTRSQELLIETVDSCIIPDCYFDMELREAGEIW